MYDNRMPASNSGNLKRVLLTLALASPLLVNAAVPHTFSNGQTADADQVNANFADLDSRLTALEAAGLPQVSVDCDADAEALQLAIDATQPVGQEITATGTCNSISISSKRNLVINGQGTTTILGSNNEDTLNIGISQGVFINGVTVNANNMGRAAVRVGASTAIFTDLVAFNSTDDASLAVNTNGVAVIAGTSVIGDPLDPNGVAAGRALEMDERASLLVEGSATFNGEVHLSDFSFFDQDSQDNPANSLAVNGRINIGAASRMDVENGSLNGAMTASGGSLLAKTQSGQVLAMNGDISLLRSSLVLDTTNGGNINLAGATMVAQIGSGVLAYGPNITLGHDSVTVRFNSQLFVQAGAVADLVDQFNFSAFSSVFSESFIDYSKVVCQNADQVWAVQTSGSGEFNLCAVPPDPNGP